MQYDSSFHDFFGMIQSRVQVLLIPTYIITTLSEEIHNGNPTNTRLLILAIILDNLSNTSTALQSKVTLPKQNYRV